MTGLLAKITTRPCLLEECEGTIIAEPLQFISAASIYAKARGIPKRSRAGSRRFGEIASLHSTASSPEQE